jgi:hypothetical protein
MKRQLTDPDLVPSSNASSVEIKISVELPSSIGEEILAAAGVSTSAGTMVGNSAVPEAAKKIHEMSAEELAIASAELVNDPEAEIKFYV